MIKDILKSLFGPIRIGVNSSKTLLFLWLKKDLKKINGDIGVDLAGGSMLNKKFFHTSKYICVDLNLGKLNKGLLNNKDAIVINDKIENFMMNTEQQKPNLIVCVQTMGINSKFDHTKTKEIIEMMFNFLEKDGSLIFNLGNFNLDLIKIEKELKQYFNGKFETINIKYYGALNKTSSNPNYHFSKFLVAILMNIFPPLRTFFGLQKNNIYFNCYKKL